MQLKRHEIADGVFLNYIPSDKFKAGFIQVRFVVPMAKETAAKNALIFPVIVRGTEKYPDMTAMRKRFESLYDTSVGAGVWKYGDAQILALGARPLRQKYAIDDTNIVSGVVDIMEDMLLHPVTENGVFKKEYVDGEKKLAADKVRALVNNKGSYATERCKEIMFEGEPFGTYETGTADELEAVCPKCLWTQYKEVLTHARVEIFAAGEFDEKYLAGRFSDIFAQINRGEIYDTATKVMAAPAGQVKTVYEHQSVTQGKLALGFRTGCDSSREDFYIMKVLCDIFGGGTSSKLFMNVRERLSLCYYCSSGLLGEKGAMLVLSGIEFANEKKTVDEIMTQLEKVKAGEISDSELDDAKKSRRDELLRVGDSPSGMVSWAFGMVMRNRMITPEDSIAKIESVTKEQIVEKAQNIKLDTYYFLCGQEETK